MSSSTSRRIEGRRGLVFRLDEAACVRQRDPDRSMVPVGTAASPACPSKRLGSVPWGCAHAARGTVVIVRPFKCVGVGEARALGEVEVLSGNVKLAMSHVVPDLVQKVLKGQDPLRMFGDGTQIRHYTYGGDLARGIVTAMEHAAARSEDFNLSTDRAPTVLDLAQRISSKVGGDEAPFRWVSDPPFEHDVQRRVPSTIKARDELGFEATTTLDEMLDEVIPWVEWAMVEGRI
jgi:UDP-glucose 4-epimerase